jgi:hypothetical protein
MDPAKVHSIVWMLRIDHPRRREFDGTEKLIMPSQGVELSTMD